jgi:hypothetical protein
VPFVSFVLGGYSCVFRCMRFWVAEYDGVVMRACEHGCSWHARMPAYAEHLGRAFVGTQLTSFTSTQLY